MKIKRKIQEMLEGVFDSYICTIIWGRGGENVRALRATAEIDVSTHSPNSAVEESLYVCFHYFVEEIHKRWPSNNLGTLYLYAPEEWTWCHDEQRVFEPIRIVMQSSGWDRKLLVGMMVGWDEYRTTSRRDISQLAVLGRNQDTIEEVKAT